MTRIQKLLAATDFSAPARHAAARASHVARGIGARLTLLHVMSQTALDDLQQWFGVPALDGLADRLLDGAGENLLRLASTLESRYGGPVEATVSTGPVVPEIARQAEVLAADLIVVGGRGEAFMRHALLGSTAERLLRKTLRAVLVVKQNPIDDYRRALVPIDFSPWSLAAPGLARAVAPRAELVLLHACDLPFEGKLRYAGIEDTRIDAYHHAARHRALEQMEALAASRDLPPERTRLVVVQGDPARQVLEQEQEQDCDVIVLGKHGRNMLETLLIGSVTKHVLAASSCDVLMAAGEAS
jgi:nucleotide-binding universal stress UspA family protein